ncbi:Uncharacterised protein [Salmonella enterica subsp. enterica serovar Typhi]|nr:Uncharacterised protein [Salmonella enterica subsp. enterica serovar Typhi]CHM34480.1 Uncharacterised protein [Salmonella enterica subsp. enterica serovar Typhi]CQY72178.1 Uncharacterised protein [Salmonella enterica subsp. enterica serovar Typhi]
MVGNLVTPHAVTGDTGKVSGLVLVELRAVHHLQPFMSIAQVVKRAERGINLPDMIGMQTGHFSIWCRGIQLFRVQAIVTQGTADGIFGQREKLTGGFICSACGDKAVSPQGFHCIRDGIETLTVLAGGLTQCGRYQRGFVAGQGAAPGIGAFFAFISHRDLLQPAQQSGAGHAKFSTGSVVYCTAFTMPRVTCRAGDINQSFSQGSIHWLCLQPVNLWRRLSQP